MFATVYQWKRGKEFGEEVEETSLHLVTGLSTLGKKNFELQCVKRWRQLTLLCAQKGCLSSLFLPTPMHTPFPRYECCLWVRKTKEKHLLIAPAWLQVRVKDHLSSWVLRKRLLWRGPSLQHPSAHLPASPPMLSLYFRGLRKPEDYIKHSPSGQSATAINTCAPKRRQRLALSVRILLWWAGDSQVPCLHMHQEKLHNALGNCQDSFFPPSLEWQSLFLMLFSLCLLLLQEQDGPLWESCALAAAAGTSLAGQQQSREGLPSKQLQSQGKLRQKQGKSFSSESVMSCLPPFPKPENLSACVFTQRQTPEVRDAVHTSTDAASGCIWWRSTAQNEI